MGIAAVAGALVAGCSRAPDGGVGTATAGPGAPAQYAPAENAAFDPVPGRAGPFARTGGAIPATGTQDDGPVGRWGRAQDAAIRAHLMDKAAAGDDYAALALALMADPAGDPAAALAARARAIHEVALALPDDPLVAWLEAQSCHGLDDVCDAGAAMERLQRLDPDNGHAWLDSLADADDPAAIDRILGTAAAAGRIDSYHDAMVAMYAEATRDAPLSPVDPDTRAAIGEAWGLGRPPTDAELALLHAAVAGSAQGNAAMPSLAGISDACRSPANASRTSSCQALMASFANSNSLSERQAGLASMVRATAGRADGAAWRERLRRHYWLMEQYRRQRLSQIPGFLERQLQDGEFAAIEYAMRMRGLSQPPTGWLPGDPRERALVTTGHDPGRG